MGISLNFGTGFKSKWEISHFYGLISRHKRSHNSVKDCPIFPSELGVKISVRLQVMWSCGTRWGGLTCMVKFTMSNYLYFWHLVLHKIISLELTLVRYLLL